ncbi:MULTISPECIES: fibronectin type III domain-containing protein [unclassified Streptomyces]|uniref:fibronectin type III domain-containing protein n=1 Tax=unclassified Streptomyces TaxID=2593676 RepID=UPI0038094E66
MSEFTWGTGRVKRAVVTGVATTMVVLGGSIAPGAAQAAVPVFPDNISVFPDRDFVSVDGFSAHAGEQITVEVRRPGAGTVGSATGTVASAASIEAGNPAVEVNHPGGLCWGAGGGPQVTPDIRAGDVVSVRFGGTAVADTTTLDTGVTGGSLTTPTRLVIQGRLGPEVDPAFVEQRIIEPALRDTEVGRRDVRALPGPLVTAPKGGYRSGLSIADGVFTATYEFTTAETAEIAAGGLYEALAWQSEDGGGNPQGVTISEFGEPGGPGMGNCPPGPAQQRPAPPTGVVVLDQGDSAAVSWTPPERIPGLAPVLGYTVRAVDQLSQGGVQGEFGVRVNDPAATTATLPASVRGKRVEVRSFSETGESWPPALQGNTPSGDTTPPAVKADPAGGFYAADTRVTLTADEPDAQIYYTLDGSDPLEAGTTGPAAKPYTEPIDLAHSAGRTTLRFVAFDKAGNASSARVEEYTFGAARAPGAPREVTARAGDGNVTVRWTAPEDAGTSPVTGYGIVATPAGGAPVRATAAASASSAVLDGLTNGTAYSVAVTGVNAVGGGTPSTPVDVTPEVPAVDELAVTLSRWRSGDLRIEGTGSVAGARLTFRSGSPSGPVFAEGVTVQRPAAGAAVGTWTLRVRDGDAANTNPSPVHISSDKGGALGPLRVGG